MRFAGHCKHGLSHINAMNENQETTSIIINMFVY